MKILITGAAGFIGSHLVRALVKEGYHCRCLVRKTSNIEGLKRLKNIEFVYGDIRDRNSLMGITKGIDVVYHLAAMSGHDLPSQKTFEKFRITNVIGTRNILDECTNESIKRFIYISSTAAIGTVTDEPVSESTKCNPYTPYQVTKFEAEQIVKHFHEKYSLSTVIIRPSAIYGPGCGGDLLTILRIAKSGLFPKIGNTGILYPILYIDDFIYAMKLLINKGKSGETYIIAPGTQHELQEIVEIAARHLGIRVFFVYVPAWFARLVEYWTEMICKLVDKKPILTHIMIHSMLNKKRFDVSKAKRDLGFEERIPLKTGIRNTIECFIRNKYL